VDLSPRTIRFTAACLLASTLLAVPGCQVWQLGSEQREVLRSDRTLHALRERLGFDDWRSNVHWSAIESGAAHSPAASSSERFRWTLPPHPPGKDFAEVNQRKPENNQSPHADAQASPTPKGAAETPPGDGIPAQANSSEEPAAPQTTSADGSGDWPQQLDELLATLDSRGASPSGSGGDVETADSYLAQLAERDELAGWNAAILWGRRNPPGAARIASVLERLVAHPPLYDPEAKRVAGPPGESNAAHEDRPQGRLPVSGWLRGSPTESPETTAKPARAISAAMQAAAAEAWCLVLAAGSDDKAGALAPAGRLLEQADLPIAVRGELFRSVGHFVPPVVIPRLAEALREARDGEQAPVEVRRAAVEACLLYAQGGGISAAPAAVHADRPEFDPARWPATLWSCQYDSDAQTRLVFGRWAAVARPPDAFSLLKAQLTDAQPSVRDAALVSLGVLKSEESLAELRKQARRPEERIRAAAAKGLAFWGIRELAPMTADTSSRVREAVVTELGARPEPQSALLLRDLLVDGSPQVQASVVDAVAGWPDTLAMPLLLFGMQESSRALRQRCFFELRKRTGFQASFPFDAPREERIAAAKQLAEKHSLPATLLDELRQAGLRAAPKIDALHAGEVEAALGELARSEPASEAHRSALNRLKELTAAELPLVERFLREAPEAGTEAIYRELLPAWSAVYEGLNDLESTDVLVRRRAAERIAHAADSASLGPVATRRLGRLLAREQDELVWRYAIAAVMPDSDDESAHVALLAVNHAWPDIRILGCEYIGRHGNPRHASALAPLMRDSNKRVQLAAVKAVGHCRNALLLDDRAAEGGGPPVPGLRSLMNHADRDMRFAVAAAMSRLGDPQAMQELVRLCSEPNAGLRESAVREMGATGQTRFVEHLIRLAWTEQDAQVKRAILESLDQLVPADRRPVGLADQTGYDAKVKFWVLWWDQRRT
jgi:HEAT repeat protein